MVTATNTKLAARVCTPCQTPILSLKWSCICKNPAVLPRFTHAPLQSEPDPAVPPRFMCAPLHSEPEVCPSLQEATPSAFLSERTLSPGWDCDCFDQPCDFCHLQGKKRSQEILLLHLSHSWNERLSRRRGGGGGEGSVPELQPSHCSATVAILKSARPS